MGTLAHRLFLPLGSFAELLQLGGKMPAFTVTRTLAVLCSLSLGGVLVSNAAHADAFSDMTPVGASALGSITVDHNLINMQDVTNRSVSTGNSINTQNGGQVINGAIQNNAITNNHGLTAVMMNTGNQVNFNNSTIVNVFFPH